MGTRHTTLFRPLLAATLALLTGAVRGADVSVSYLQPERFSDVPYRVSERDQVLKALTAHFVQLGARLPAGRTLKVEVLDVDLAGRMMPRRGLPDEIRVLRGGADWPHIHLRYALEQDGALVLGGDEELADMSYQMRLNRYGDGDPLRYEKQMLDDWYRRTFAPAVASQGH